MSDYRELAPPPPLAALVECLWTSRSVGAPVAPAVHRVLPDGCMDILFDFTAAGDQRVAIIGTMRRPQLIATRGAIDLLGLRFRPGGLAALLRLDAAELTDARAGLSSFVGSRAFALWQRLVDQPAAFRPALLIGWLGEMAGDAAPLDPLIAHCVTRIERAAGTLRIASLTADTGVGARQLERKFARFVGVAPKTFARITRFKSVIAAGAAGGADDWAQRAAACGFADQAHLVREFKSLSGLTPGNYFAAAR